MKTLPLAACALLVALGGCDLFSPRQGVGFTGIDGEPATLPEADTGGAVTRGWSVSQALAKTPPARVQVKGNAMSDLARAAIANGGRTDASAVAVGGAGGQTLMLSTVQVNGTLFAVLRQPEGVGRRMAQGQQAQFGGAVERLTGCLAAGSVYNVGGAARPSGLAVPLDCR